MRKNAYLLHKSIFLNANYVFLRINTQIKCKEVKRVRGREELSKDKKKMREIMSEYKVITEKQFIKALNGVDPKHKKTIITYMLSDNTMYRFGEMFSSEENWQEVYDGDLIKAFWVMLDFWEKVRYNCVREYPSKLLFATDNGDTYDVIVANKGDENVINMFYMNFGDEDTKHFVIVEDKEQIKKLNFEGIKAFCIVDDDGNVDYYRREE